MCVCVSTRDNRPVLPGLILELIHHLVEQTDTHQGMVIVLKIVYMCMRRMYTRYMRCMRMYVCM